MGRLQARFQTDDHHAIEPSGRNYDNDLAVLHSKVDELVGQLQHLTHKKANGPSDTASLVREAKRIYSLRRGVDKVFANEGFSRSPAWDIMLDLFVARDSGKSISVSSAGIGASCPSTTALRWLQVLELEGLIVRSNDPTDRRRALISLTDMGYAKTAKALRLHVQN